VNPPRLTLASELGQGIDGAWWLRTGRMASELAATLPMLESRLGGIIDINVNWSIDGPPGLIFYGGECKHPPVMTVHGKRARTKLLIVPSNTGTALALMVLRQAAFLPVLSNHIDTAVFKVAASIVKAARSQQAQL